jgi:methionyl-tRNA formyltransferase
MESLPIAADETTATLHDKLATLGGKLIVDALHKLERGALSPTSQPEQGTTYAAKIAKEEAALDLTQPAAVLHRKLRAFNPFPGAVAQFNGVPVKFWRAELAAAPAGATPGQVLAANAHDGVLVACGEQKPSGKRLAAAEFLKGFPLEGGHFN